MAIFLSQLATIKKHYKDADFWVTSTGRMSRTYNPSHWGVKVRRTDLLLPDYLYYLIEFALYQGVNPSDLKNLQLRPPNDAQLNPPRKTQTKRKVSKKASTKRRATKKK